jgi:hypothetical protein
MTDTLMVALAPALFLTVLLMMELGHQYRLASHLPNDSESNSGVNPAIGTVLALMGLVLAFSFSSAAGRLDASRITILDEANAIETAWLRIDLADPAAQPRLRDLFRQYVDSRIHAYGAPALGAYNQRAKISSDLMKQIWALAVEATPPSRPQDRMLLLPALNAMADGASARTISLSTHLPPAILAFLFGTVLIGSMLIGTLLACAGRRHWFYRLVIALVLSSVVYAIVDMEYPSLGAFNLLRHADSLLVNFRESIR